MMKTIEFVLDNPGTSEKSFYIPLKDPSRLINLSVSAGAGQSGGTVTVEDGDGQAIMEADLSGIDSAGDTVTGKWKDAASEKEKNAVFDRDNPLLVKVDLESDSTVGIQLVVDPFQIGQHEGFD